MKRSFVFGRAEVCSRRWSLTWSERPLPPTASLLQSPRYSSRIQWSTRLAVPASGSEVSSETSEQKGLLGVIRRDHADHLTGTHRLTGRDRQLPHDAVAERMHLVLHLHRLDDADHLSGRHRIPI